MPSKLFIIGLGNIGNEYENTRHNVAWIIFDSLVNTDWNDNKYAKSFIGTNQVGESDVFFIKPKTFMNKTGEIIPYMQKEYGLSGENLCVLHDDIDLPIGTIKISYDRGDGGHNGIKSIFEVLESRAFLRIRIGVSIVDDSGVLHKPDVLGNFSKNEMEMIKKEITLTVGKVIESLIVSGKEKTMTKYN